MPIRNRPPVAASIAALIAALLLIALSSLTATAENPSPPEGAHRRDAGRASKPAVAPVPSAPPVRDESTADADAEVAATRERFEAMQRLSEEHARATADATTAFQARMQAAKTPEERRAIQETFQRERREREEELKRRLTELGGR